MLSHGAMRMHAESMLPICLEPNSQSGLPMPLKRIRSLQLRWLHFLQPDIIPSMFSSCSLVATSSLGEAIEMINLVETRQEEGTGAGHNWDEVRPKVWWQHLNQYGQVGTHNPTWCDLCGELIWGLYAVGAWQCTNCGYYSHIKVASQKCKGRANFLLSVETGFCWIALPT